MTFTERKIIFHVDYFTRFYVEQSAKVQEKIEYVLRIVRQVERVPKTFLQHLEDTEGFMKFELDMVRTSFVFSAVLTKAILLFCSMAFKKRPKRHRRMNWNLPSD